MMAPMAARLTVVGSSDAFNAAGRSHSCYLLDGDGFETIMVDFGATALRSLRSLERDPTAIGAWLITHLHGDHIGGFPFLLIDAMFNAVRTSTLEVLGPAGVEKRVMDLFEVAYGDVIERERPYELSFRELLPGGDTALCGTTVNGFAAEHMDPPEQPLCLRVDLPSGQSVAFSGDTAMCDGLLEAAAGVDLLVAECSALAPPCGRHCSWEDWLEVLPKLTAKRVLLTHMNAAVRSSVDRLLSEAPDGVDLLFADDGLELEL
jgi:ribonuclease BN (tRNA processing enzyme)